MNDFITKSDGQKSTKNYAMTHQVRVETYRSNIRNHRHIAKMCNDTNMRLTFKFWLNIFLVHFRKGLPKIARANVTAWKMKDFVSGHSWRLIGKHFVSIRC